MENESLDNKSPSPRAAIGTPQKPPRKSVCASGGLELVVGFLLSLTFVFQWGLKLPGRWASTEGDSGDYRYLGENLWGIPHDLSTYIPAFHTNWGKFLTVVPFRQLGVGSFYAFTHYFLGDSALHSGRFSLQVLIASSYAILSRTVSSRFGRAAGIICLIFALFLKGSPRDGTRGSRLGLETFGVQLLFLLTVNFKVQWIALTLSVSAIQAGSLAWRGNRRHAAVILGLACLSPLSLTAVNRAYSDYPGIIAGTGLHAMWKMGGSGDVFLRKACAEPGVLALSPRFCAEKRFWYSNWGEFTSFQYPAQDLKSLSQALDQSAARNLDLSWGAVRDSLSESVRNFSNFPPYAPLMIPEWARLALDFASIGLCLVGLLLSSTRFTSIFCLGLWCVPIAANVATAWDTRYIVPMAGFALLNAGLVSLELKALWIAEGFRVRNCEEAVS